MQGRSSYIKELEWIMRQAWDICDHPFGSFGLILAENDPGRNQGVFVGESWTHHLNCWQWGVHWPHVARIADKQNMVQSLWCSQAVKKTTRTLESGSSTQEVL